MIAINRWIFSRKNMRHMNFFMLFNKYIFKHNLKTMLFKKRKQKKQKNNLCDTTVIFNNYESILNCYWWLFVSLSHYKRARLVEIQIVALQRVQDVSCKTYRFTQRDGIPKFLMQRQSHNTAIVAFNPDHLFLGNSLQNILSNDYSSVI